MTESTENIEIENDEAQSEMGFFDHLGELRRRIIFVVIALGAGFFVSFYYIGELLESFLLRPAKSAGFTLQNLNAMGQPILFIKLALYASFVLTFPFTVYQVWKFVEPGLYKNEKSWAKSIVFFTTLCFLLGTVFAYYVMVPSMMEFAAGFGTSQIQNIIEVNGYLSFITMLMLAAGLFFELPVVSYILSRVGLLTPDFMRNYRRHSIVVILVIAAIITPSPDPFNQLIVAVPIYVLYELSIFISGYALKQYLKKRDV